MRWRLYHLWYTLKGSILLLLTLDRDEHHISVCSTSIAVGYEIKASGCGRLCEICETQVSGWKKELSDSIWKDQRCEFAHWLSCLHNSWNQHIVFMGFCISHSTESQEHLNGISPNSPTHVHLESRMNRFDFGGWKSMLCYGRCKSSHRVLKVFSLITGDKQRQDI